MKVRKKTGKTVQAYCLGEKNQVLDSLIQQGKIIPRGDTVFEIMSQEVLNGKSGKGQIALRGDFVKVDTFGEIYPNEAEFFKKITNG